MPNIAYITDADIENNTVPADLVAAIRARRANGALLNLDRMLLHSPPVARGWNVFMGAIRRELELPALLRELAICAVAKLNRAEYEWLQHAPELLAAGGTVAQRDALSNVSIAIDDENNFNAIERLVLKLTREMTQNIEVASSSMQALRSHLPDRQVAEIVATIAAYNMVSRYLVALDIGIE
jgi:alkylhydroperoxidase family enzyme